MSCKICNQNVKGYWFFDEHTYVCIECYYNELTEMEKLNNYYYGI